MSKNNDNTDDGLVPHFSTPEKVRLVLDDIQKIEENRALDRALINGLFNGERPFGPEEVAKYQIQVNVNWGVGSRILEDANRQVNNALIPPGNFFHALSRGGAVARKNDYSEKFTKESQRSLKNGESGRRHAFLLKSRDAAFCMHGIGPMVWLNDFRLLPRVVCLEDLLIPTDTWCDFSNLSHFGVNLYLTPGELYALTHGDKVDTGWNVAAVRRILADLKDDKGLELFQHNEHTWNQRPEEVEEIFKQNRGWLESDAVPKVKLRVFFYTDPISGNWYRKIILRENTPNQPAEGEFIYDCKGKPFADKLSKILHVQFGDNSLVSPLKYHSVRGLGVRLYSPVETDNRLRCQFIQHLFENLRMYFRKTDQVDRSVSKFLEMFQYSVIQDGYSIVPQSERHQVDDNLVGLGLAQLRQLMAENSASFLQNTDEAPNKEMTATETRARLNTASVMISGMLDMAYMQEKFYYEELVRRLLETDDPVAKSFRQRCVSAGIPQKLMVFDNWEIVIDRVFGSGDPTLAHAQAQWLLENQQRFEPESQRRILRIATSVTLDDPDLAEMLVPNAPADATTGTYAAEDVFATLMRGIPVKLRQGIDQVGYVKALLGMMQVTVKQIADAGNVGTPMDIIGLMTVAQNIGQHLAILSADPKEKQNVKVFGDMLGKVMNEVKAFAQRQQEQQQKQNPQLDPETMAKIQGMIAMDSVKAKTKEAAAEQRLEHTARKFEQQQKIKAGQALADTHLKAMQQAANGSSEQSPPG